MADPEADDLDPVLDRILDKDIRNGLREFQQINSLSSSEALNLILEEHFVEYSFREEVPAPVKSESANSETEEKRILGCPLTTAFFIAGMFGFAALFYTGFFSFFHWLNGLRIPGDAWLGFAALGSEHLMFVPILFPALTFGAGLTRLIIIPFVRRQSIDGAGSDLDSYQEWRLYLTAIFLTSIIAFPIALYGADGYGWVDEDGIHINPLFGVGKTEDYEWNHITHVHTMIESDGDQNIRSEFRVIFFDGRTQNLKEGVRNRFLDVYKRVGLKLKTVEHLDVSQQFDGRALERLRKREDQEYAKRLIDALNVVRQPIPGLWP